MMIKGGKIQKSNKKSFKAKAKNDTCHYCKEVSHCKRNCPAYLAELIKKKKQVGTASSSDVFIIELFSFPTKSWVYDTSCDNCHYAPTITRGVVLVSRLVDNGFVQCFTDYGILVSKNNVFYLMLFPAMVFMKLICMILYQNVNCIYNVSNKRVKRNLDSTYLWHCHLAYINKKRIKQLQQDGLLKATDDESFDKCESCLSGNMTKKPVPHSNKRAKDLLGIIHTDVCGLLRHVSRQGAIYFITFTYDYSRYGYVYLLKHKHELTPLYTPQHNGVSERRNRTLLDMVRSMMNLTTLPLSFWDYALESATRILNMIPTKKVDKNPYELWYEKVPNLSYLKVWGCEALVKRDTPNKLQQRSVKCIFIGYPKETMSYYFYFPPRNKIVVTIEIPMEVEGFEPPQEEDISIRMSERTCRAPNRLSLNVKMEEHSLGDLNEPTSYKAAMLDSESNKWIDAMNAEIQSMMDNMVWVLVDLPPNCKTVGSFVDPNHPRKVCKLQISIYGLKQASRSWNKIFDEEIKRFGFTQNLDEPCVYQKASKSNVTFLILYVDDINIMGNHIPSLQSVKDYLGKCFAMKDLGKAAFILGIKIYRDRSKRLIGLSQNAYMDKILKRYKMDNSKRGTIPIVGAKAIDRVSLINSKSKVTGKSNSPKSRWLPMSERVFSPQPVTQYNPITGEFRKESEKAVVVKGNYVVSKSKVGKSKVMAVSNVSVVVSEKSAVDEKDNPKVSKVSDKSNNAVVVVPVIEKVPVATESVKAPVAKKSVKAPVVAHYKRKTELSKDKESDKETEPVVVADVKAPVVAAIKSVVKKDIPKVMSKVLDKNVKASVVKESVKVAVVKKSVKASSVVIDNPSSVVANKVDVVKGNINVVADKVVKENVLSVVADKALNNNVVVVADKALGALKNKLAGKGKKPAVGKDKDKPKNIVSDVVKEKFKPNPKKMILSKEDDRENKLKGNSKKDVCDFEFETDVVDYFSDEVDRKRKKLKIKAGLKRKRSGKKKLTKKVEKEESDEEIIPKKGKKKLTKKVKKEESDEESVPKKGKKKEKQLTPEEAAHEEYLSSFPSFHARTTPSSLFSAIKNSRVDILGFLTDIGFSSLHNVSIDHLSCDSNNNEIHS
ncbi:retrotransposon protein, putative, ty1-copia subclass [Tanacetum coccineum]|uniref:Retrotransposon protein, putative, ty1-copia subclass n=1 Tax=Tanacetum coccineum TaxID=301880 RepID=A0ABQ5JAM1_9ASTR